MPGVGQLILLVGPWQLIFVVMGMTAAVVGLWGFIRLRESLAPENRRALDFRSVAEGFATVLTNRVAISYGLSGMFLFGVILGLVNTAQQIYVGIYQLGAYFPFAFAVMAGSSAVASLFCPRVIERIGVRRTAHGAMLIFVAACALWLALSAAGFMPLWLFLTMVATVMPMVAATYSTTTSLAMEPLGEVAGSASAIFGSL